MVEIILQIERIRDVVLLAFIGGFILGIIWTSISVYLWIPKMVKNAFNKLKK